MPPQEVLILAMTQMLSGICTAGSPASPTPSLACDGCARCVNSVLSCRVT